MSKQVKEVVANDDIAPVPITKLTNRQSLFVKNYIALFGNATQAAIKSGYSKNRASEIGYQLLQKTTVLAEIQRQQQLKAKELDFSAEKMLLDIEDIKTIAKNNGDLNLALKCITQQSKMLGYDRQQLFHKFEKKEPEAKEEVDLQKLNQTELKLLGFLSKKIRGSVDPDLSYTEYKWESYPDHFLQKKLSEKGRWDIEEEDNSAVAERT